MLGKWPAVASERDNTMWPSRIAARRVADRIHEVVAFDQHGVEPGDAAAVGSARALEQAREQAEHRRRVAASRGRLAGGETDLALRHGEAGEAVHQQQHVEALVAEPLGDPRRGEGGAQAHQRGLVRGRHDDHCSGEAFRPEVVLDELANLSTALADRARAP